MWVYAVLVTSRARPCSRQVVGLVCHALPTRCGLLVNMAAASHRYSIMHTMIMVIYGDGNGDGDDDADEDDDD